MDRVTLKKQEQFTWILNMLFMADRLNKNVAHKH